ncbi:MAG: cation transporter [Anaerolineales bacterium]|nr:cation transporter [Anaerolineales bacterium]
MSHHHHHHHHHDSAGNIKLAFFLNLSFTILEIIGGFWVNSVAILSDALHDLGDTLSLGLAWGLARYGGKAGDNRFSYGYQRFSLLAALLNTVVLIAGTGFILSETIPRLLAPEQPDLNGMLLFALVGILVNGLAAWRVQSGNSLNEKVVAWHLFEDVLGWAAVLIASLVMRFVDLPILDPIMSLLITLYVLYNMVGYLRQTAAIFLQAVPAGIDLPHLESRLLTISEVESVHHTHLWSLDGEHHVLSTHLVVPATADRPAILRAKKAVQTLVTEYDIGHVTVEVERADELCLMAPDSCEE